MESNSKVKINSKGYYQRFEETNPSWKGSRVGLSSLHEWVRNRKTKPKLCECCGVVPPRDLANISQEYKRDLSDWEWLCRRCHMTKDGRIQRTINRNKKGMSKESIEKMRLAKIGSKASLETRKKMSLSQYRRHAQNA